MSVMPLHENVQAKRSTMDVTEELLVITVLTTALYSFC